MLATFKTWAEVVVWLYIRHAVVWIWEWAEYILPAVANLILILLGVVMSLPALAQKIEDTPKYRKWLAGICVVFGLIGFRFDVGQRRSSDITMRKMITDMDTSLRNTNVLLNETTILVTTMNDTLVEFRSLSPKVSGINDHLANLDKEIADAETQKDSKKVRDLQAKRKVDLANLISIIPNIISDILFTSQACRRADAELTEQINAARLRGEDKEQMGPPRGKVWEVCKEKLIPQAKSADSIREALLREIPLSQQTEADKTYTLTFARVTTNAFSPDAAIRTREATDYLRDLAKRVAQK